jgi:hypothetical protein
MSCGVMRAAHAYFSSPVLITVRFAASWRDPTAALRVSTCRASPQRAPRASNILKTIANLADATLQAVPAGFFSARWVLACVLHSVRSGGGQVVIPSFALTPTGGSAYRRPPVWRAVVRPARYFFMAPQAPFHWRVSAANLLTIGTKVSKSTGLGTWRSKPASMAAATSPFDA